MDKEMFYVTLIAIVGIVALAGIFAFTNTRHLENSTGAEPTLSEEEAMQMAQKLADFCMRDESSFTECQRDLGIFSNMTYEEVMNLKLETERVGMATQKISYFTLCLHYCEGGWYNPNKWLCAIACKGYLS